MNPPFDEDYFNLCVDVVKKFTNNIYIIITPNWPGEYFVFLQKNCFFSKQIFMDNFEDKYNNVKIKKHKNIVL
jgi:hypothetical protein